MLDEFNYVNDFVALELKGTSAFGDYLEPVLGTGLCGTEQNWRGRRRLAENQQGAGKITGVR